MDTGARANSPLRAERHAQGLRLKDVADEAGVSISLVSTVEAGYVPPLRTQQRLAGALGASSGSFWPGAPA